MAECIQQILALQGIDDYPVFKRNRISNIGEQVDIIIKESPWLDNKTILQKLPNIKAEEVSAIIEQTEADELDRMMKQTSDVSDDESMDTTDFQE